MTGARTVVQLDGRAKVLRPLPSHARAAAILHGLELYERGEAFEAHEAWEPAWMGTADVAERALVQGLIKLAAADVHAARGNPRGVARNLDGALDQMRDAHATSASHAPGITVDLTSLMDLVAARLSRAAAGETTPTIRIPWRPG
ncbi:hypothetical protein BH20CHL7_BH20CHL7_02680 [soil metagenome]